MYFGRDKRNIKCKYLLVLVLFFFVGVIFERVLCYKSNNLRFNEMGNVKQIESGQKDKDLREILVNIHMDYINKQRFMEEKYGIPNNYYENRICYESKDLENVIFYMDNEEMIYFIPTSMVNKTINLNGKIIKVNESEEDGKYNLYLYSYKIFNPEPKRVIFPKLDKHVSILSCEVQDFIEELHYLGTVYMTFPKNVPEEVGKLYENEYTDAVVKLIHSFLFDNKEYGNYLGIYAPDIDSIIHANRLVIPLLVTENDKVEKIEIRRDERNINFNHYYLIH